MAKRHPAPGALIYEGDLTRDVLGQVMGPTTYGSLVVAVSATYEPSLDQTVVRCAYANDADLEAVMQSTDLVPRVEV
jgi:hypothetical protein